MKSRKNNLIIAAAVFFAASMVVFPEVTQAGSKTAMIIWVNSVVPVLLPFFIFSDFIRRTGDMEKLPVYVYPFVIAFMSGYPMGARVVGDMVRQGSLNIQEGKRVLSYSLVTGPAFVIGVTGSMIGSMRCAVIVAAAHYGGAFLNGIFFSLLSGRNVEKVRAGIRESSSTCSYMESFSQSITGAFRAMAVILAYLMIFMIGINMLESAGLFLIIESEGWAAFVKGIFEMTVGINMLGMCSISQTLKCIGCAFLISFGGFSVIGQSVSMAQGSGIGLGSIFAIKLMHGVWAALISLLLTMFI